MGIAATVGCGGGSSPTAPSPVRAQWNVTASPSPIIAGGGGYGYQYSADFTVTVKETSGGVGGNVNFVNATIRNDTTGVELGTINFSATEIIDQAGSNHVAARGTLNIPLGFYYTLAWGGRQATLTIAIQLADDRGNVTNRSLELKVI